MGSIISLHDVNLHLKSDAGDVHILKDVSLNLAAGKIIGVMGPSGSGKTSLLMLLGGLEKPTSGKIRANAHALEQMNEDELAHWRRAYVGIVFQNFHLLPTMNALENVAVPLELNNTKNATARAEEALAAVGLKDRVKHYPAQLSGGEQQRVAIARAFAAKPKLILADEPTGNLDEETGKRVIDLMFKMTRETGSTLVLVTHDAELAKKCDQIIHIRDGRISA